MLTKDFVKMESKQVKPPLLLNGEDSSPAGTEAVIGGGECWSGSFAPHTPKEATLWVYLVDDSTIGYFRGGDFIDYTNAGVKIELVKDSPRLPEPETDIFYSVAYSEEFVDKIGARNKNGKIHRQGLKELGMIAALEYLVQTDI